MPTPRRNESESDFVQRCIPIVIDEGTAEGGEQAAAVCHSMWRRARRDMNTLFVQIDQYTNITPGEPFRLFPFGTIVKDGRRHEITPEIARTIKLPHFNPPIKLGSHKDETPAGGFIKALEVRDDGLYAIPEWNDAGLKALDDGAYRYHSPEIIWDGLIEDSVTGNEIEGTIIMGAALTHTPALGEAAAFFETKVTTKGDENMGDTVTLPVSWLDKFLGREPEGKQEPPQPQGGEQEDFAAIKAEAEQYQAQLAEATERIEEYEAERARMEAERKHAQRVAHFAAEFEETVVGDDEELHELLAAVDDEERAETLVRKFKALAAQAAEAGLEDELGASGDDTTNGQNAADAVIKAYAAEHNVSYMDAFAAIQREQPEVLRGG